MVWFDQSLRLRPCEAGISGWLEALIKPCTASGFNPIKLPEVKTGIDGWKTK